MTWIWIAIATVVAAAVYANYKGYLTFGYTPPTQASPLVPASAATAFLFSQPGDTVNF